jgi:homospermidine synthase
VQEDRRKKAHHILETRRETEIVDGIDELGGGSLLLGHATPQKKKTPTWYGSQPFFSFTIFEWRTGPIDPYQNATGLSSSLAVCLAGNGSGRWRIFLRPGIVLEG